MEALHMVVTEKETKVWIIGPLLENRKIQRIFPPF